MGKARILLIEDDADNQEMVRFLLENAGFTVLTAHNGQHGLRLARQELPDLILLDLSMPELDGWSVAKKLKADPATKAIPLVALTAHTLPGDRRKALSAGCDGYIAKPMKIATFIADIGKHLQNSQENDE